MFHIVCPNPAVDRTLIFESINFEKPNRPLDLKEFPGGKGFNVAYALSFFHKKELIIHTMLGGYYGEQVQKLANNKGYKLEITDVEKNTRLCNILVDQSKKSVLPIYEKGFELEQDVLNTFTEHLVNSIHSGDYLIFSGSLMQGMPTDYICQINAKLLNLGISANLCVDTSGIALQKTYCSTAPYMIKINDEEILDIFPNEELESIEDYYILLRDKIDKKIPYFIITLGKKGIIARANNKYFFSKAKSVNAVNPIASGDFSLGRLINGLNKELPFEKTLEDAISFSTANVLNWFPEVTEKQLFSIKKTLQTKELTVDCFNK